MKYKIPKNFDMGGQTIKVKVKPDVGKDGAIGFYSSYENRIEVQTHLDGSLIDKSKVEQTFWHEYAHCLLEHCRQDDLGANEDLVDLMGEFLYQSLGKKKW